MKHIWILSFFLIVFACSKKRGDDSIVLARVNNQVLTANRLESVLSPQQRTSDQIRTYIHDWVNNAILFQEAKKMGLDKDEILINKRESYFIKLVVGAYLETEASPAADLSKENIRQYYRSNAASFIRSTDDAVLHHFITDNISDARTIQKKLKKKKSGETMDELFSLYGVDTKTVKKGRLIKELDDVVFQGDGVGVVGPVVVNNKFHIIEIVKKNKKGTRVGLEGAYDEIYQRVLKQNRAAMLNSIVDSLRESSNVFINSLYN
tara:strand:+ start:501 stop:1292 length:792 start_codon:yes stop_codon:yes gene_type:complete